MSISTSNFFEDYKFIFILKFSNANAIPPKFPSRKFCLDVCENDEWKLPLYNYTEKEESLKWRAKRICEYEIFQFSSNTHAHDTVRVFTRFNDGRRQKVETRGNIVDQISGFA